MFVGKKSGTVLLLDKGVSLRPKLN